MSFNAVTVEYSNPVYANQEGTMIDCEVNHPEFGWIAFTATSFDPEQYGRDLYVRIVADGGISPYVAPTPPESD